MKKRRARASIPLSVAATACAALLGITLYAQPAQAASDQQSVEVLRDTVINLLQALVQRGVITRQQAEDMVKNAQDKANADLAAQRAKEEQQKKEEQGAIPVPYVPQIIQEKIAKDVAAQVKPAVTTDVIQEAKKEGWGVPGALPDWMRKVRVSGDLTLRFQDDLYGRGNDAGCPAGTPYGNCTVLDFNAINAAGGISQAGVNAFLNINQDRERFRGRARLGVDVDLSDSFDAEIRLATGSLTVPSSETQTFGSEFGRYTAGFDRVYIRWQGKTSKGFPYLSAIGGKFADPFFAPTELVYADILDFDGVALTGRVGFGDGSPDQSHVFLTVGGFPIQEIQLVSKNDKWMVGGQLGAALRFGDGQQLTLAGAYYDFVHMQGIPNDYGSTLNNYTIPLHVTHGNDMCNIANPADQTQSAYLFALCSQFRIADVSAGYVLPIGRYTLSMDAEAARNLGFKRADIANLFGYDIQPRVDGYVGDLAFGDPSVFEAWHWRGLLGYRYVQRDAVLDAITDPDFHEGGTDAQGYFLRADLGLANNVWTRFRYLSGREIDGPRYRVDVIQLDLNARF
jgi:hypothetical protein